MDINELMSRNIKRRTTLSRIPGGRGGIIPSIRSRTLEQVAPSSRLALLQRSATVRRIPGRTFIPTPLTPLRGITPYAPTATGVIPPRTGTPYVIPLPRTAAAPGGGLSTGASGLGTQLGDIGSKLSGFSDNIISEGKELLPVAVKIIAAVIILKMVLWLIRGRR